MPCAISVGEFLESDPKVSLISLEKQIWENWLKKLNGGASANMKKHHRFLVCRNSVGCKVMATDKVLSKKMDQEQIGIRNCDSKEGDFCPILCEAYVSFSINNPGDVGSNYWRRSPWGQGRIIKLFVVAFPRTVMFSSFIAQHHGRHALKLVATRCTRNRQCVAVKQPIVFMRAKGICALAYLASAVAILQVGRPASDLALAKGTDSVDQHRLPPSVRTLLDGRWPARCQKYNALPTACMAMPAAA